MDAEDSSTISWRRMGATTRRTATKMCLPFETTAARLLLSELSTLHDHDCLLTILGFLSWEDLNVFSLASSGCYKIRSHPSLDQTRSGTIRLGKGVSNARELMDKARNEHWSDAFCGHRTHLRLSNLTFLSSNIDPIDQAFIDTMSPLKQVTSLDCSMVPPMLPPMSLLERDEGERLRYNNQRRQRRRRPWVLSPFEDYVDKGFAQGLTLSLLVPHLRSIDISYLPLTMVGVAWLTENNPNLEVIRWNGSMIWPISNDSENHLESLKNLKEVYLDEARIIFCGDLDETAMWNSLLDHAQRLERVSLLGSRWYRNGEVAELSQDYLVKFVQACPSLHWFRSDLSPANVGRLRTERPKVTFVSSY